MPPDIDTSVVLPPSMTEAGAKADTTCRLKTGHRYNADGVCEWCNAEAGAEIDQWNSGVSTIPADLPTTKAAPTIEPFDLDAYRAKEAARPLAFHKSMLIDALHKALLPYGFADKPLADLRIEIFAQAVKTIGSAL